MRAASESPAIGRDAVPRDTQREVVFAVALALVLAGIGYLLNGNGAMHLQDEGFLWYGVVHTFHGEVPLRDFRSYDPGRYYWCAAWAEIFGDGILALRLSCALFQVVGLTFGLLAARRAVHSRWMLVLVGVILAVWFFPPEKPFEAGLAMLSVFAAVKLIEQPSRARYLAAGAAVGVSGFFGRNLGLYSGLGFLALIAFLRVKLRGSKSPRQSMDGAQPSESSAAIETHAPGASELGSWLLGVVAGYSPMLVMIAIVPGFRASFVESVLFYVRQSSLNAPLPVPWPWTVDFAGTRAWPAVSAVSLGLCFLALPLFYGVALVIAVRSRAEDVGRRALLIAALFMGAIFAHHASVRSDVNHLAQCIQPMLLGLVALPLVLPGGSERARRRATLAIVAGLLVLSALAIAPRQPIGHRLGARGTANPFVSFDARGDTVWLNRAKAQYLTALTAVIRTRVNPDEKLWIAPALLTLYPLLGRTSPVWDIYPAWKASSDDEARMLTEISDVQWVLWVDQPSDGDDALQLANSHPAVWKRLMEDFERVPVPELSSSILLLRRKNG
jgi:hypothetical protein